jgi:hypothetical protein
MSGPPASGSVSIAKGFFTHKGNDVLVSEGLLSSIDRMVKIILNVSSQKFGSEE